MIIKDLITEIERLNSELESSINSDVNRTRVVAEQWSPEDGCWWDITPRKIANFDNTNFEKDKANAPF